MRRIDLINELYEEYKVLATQGKVKRLTKANFKKQFITNNGLFKLRWSTWKESGFQDDLRPQLSVNSQSFVTEAKNELLKRSGIKEPTKEQEQAAERIIRKVANNVRSNEEFQRRWNEFKLKSKLR
jgi:hypothetical protein